MFLQQWQKSSCSTTKSRLKNNHNKNKKALALMLFNEAQTLDILHDAVRHQIQNCITKPANLAKEQFPFRLHLRTQPMQ